MLGIREHQICVDSNNAHCSKIKNCNFDNIHISAINFITLTYTATVSDSSYWKKNSKLKLRWLLANNFKLKQYIESTGLHIKQNFDELVVERKQRTLNKGKRMFLDLLNFFLFIHVFSSKWRYKKHLSWGVDTGLRYHFLFPNFWFWHLKTLLWLSFYWIWTELGCITISA